MSETSGSGDTPRFSIGFLTALVSDELIPFNRVLEGRKWTEVEAEERLAGASISAWEKQIGGRTINAYSMAINSMGQTSAAVETMGFLERTGCTLVFLSGIAGSLKRDSVLKKDVVFGRKICWRGQNRLSAAPPPKDGAEKTSDCDVYRPKDYKDYAYETDFDRRLQVHFERQYPNGRGTNLSSDSFGFHNSGMLSWDYVLSHEGVVAELNTKHSDLACVEMEAGGFHEAVKRFSQFRAKRPMAAFVVRGISDYADKKDKEVDVRRVASANAALVGIDLAEAAVDPQKLNMISRPWWT